MLTNIGPRSVESAQTWSNSGQVWPATDQIPLKADLFKVGPRANSGEVWPGFDRIRGKMLDTCGPEIRPEVFQSNRCDLSASRHGGRAYKFLALEIGVLAQCHNTGAHVRQNPSPGAHAVTHFQTTRASDPYRATPNRLPMETSPSRLFRGSQKEQAFVARLPAESWFWRSRACLETAKTHFPQRNAPEPELLVNTRALCNCFGPKFPTAPRPALAARPEGVCL